jgi:hypothetical protein
MPSPDLARAPPLLENGEQSGFSLFDARAFPHKTWPLAREILHRAIRTNQAALEQALSEVTRTKKGALQVVELLAKLNREIGSRSDAAPAVRIVIGGNIPLEGMRAVTPPALLAPTDSDALVDP